MNILQMFAAPRWSEPLEVTLENLRRGHDDSKRRAELMRDQRYEITLQSVQLPFPGKRPLQFLLGPFSRADVQRSRQGVRFSIDLDHFGRKEHVIESALG